MKFNVDTVETYQADYIKGGPVPYHEKFVREKDFLAALAQRDAEIARLIEIAIEWQDGYPKQHYFQNEWFLADTRHGPVILKSLPEGQAYQYKTADDTYVSKEAIIRWALLPDSQWKREFAPSMTEKASEAGR